METGVEGGQDGGGAAAGAAAPPVPVGMADRAQGPGHASPHGPLDLPAVAGVGVRHVDDVRRHVPARLTRTDVNTPDTQDGALDEAGAAVADQHLDPPQQADELAAGKVGTRLDGVREYVKWDYELRNSAQLETVVDRALTLAMADPPGPVYLTLPREVLAEKQQTLSLRREMSRIISWVSRGFIPAVGSSSRRTRGSVARALAISSLLCSP